MKELVRRTTFVIRRRRRVLLICNLRGDLVTTISRSASEAFDTHHYLLCPCGGQLLPLTLNPIPGGNR